MKSKEQKPLFEDTKKSFGLLRRGSKEPKLIYLNGYGKRYPLVERMYPKKSRAPLAYSLVFLALAVGLAALFFSGCATYSGRLLRGTEVVAANCGTAESREECLEDIERIRVLTQHAYEQKTGLKMPEDAWSRLREININMYPVRCPKMKANGEWCGDCVCSGLLVPNGDSTYTIHARNASCLAHTSLAHEFVHFLARMTTGTSEPEHELRPDLFYQEDSVERRARAAALAEGMCDRARYRAKGEGTRPLGGLRGEQG